MAKVLVVDDVPANVQLLAADLADEGYEVATAYDGREALEAIADDPPDVILLDVMMPGIDGYEVCRKMKADPELAAIPVILLTAHEVQDEIIAGLDAGAHDYVTKPYHEETLLARLRSAVRVKQAHDEIADVNQRLDEARRVAIRASEAKSDFLASMSHELRTPLNSVIGMTDLALETDLPQDARKFIETAHRCGRALLAVINDILDFSKIEAGMLAFETIDFQIRAGIEEAFDIVASRAKEKDIHIAAIVDHDVPDRVLGDPARLRQILLNLLNNAIKFTPAGDITTRISCLSREPERATLRFEVEDTGIGVPANRIDALFDSFSQVDASTTRKYGGTGLGLTICKRIVELMHGRIGVDSTEGEGSTFWFEIELALPEKQQHARVEPAGIRGVRVLTIGGDEDGRQVLHEYLDSWGCLAAESASSREGLDQLRQAAAAGSPYDIALVDLSPQIDLHDLASEIRRDPSLADTRLALLTSSPDAGDAHRVESLGFDAYLPKPFKPPQLREALALVQSGSRPDGTGHLVTRFTAEEARRSRVRILLVEDEPDTQAAAVRLLESIGLHCDLARSGEEAVEATVRQRYDLVLMDCGLPGVDGYEATRTIRQREPSEHQTPIVAMTAHTTHTERTRCLASGMNDFLSKPVKLDDLKICFERFLPFDSNITPCRTRSALGHSLRDKNVLLVDDSSDNRALAIAYLSKTGCQVTQAENGSLAVEAVKQSPFDLILMDMQMPVMDGYEASGAVREIEAEQRRSRTPMIALTACALREEGVRCVEAGCDAHIAKPVSKQDLLRAIDQLMNSANRAARRPPAGETAPSHGTAAREAAPRSEAGNERILVTIEDELEDIVPTFLDNRRNDVGTLRSAIESRDFDTIRRLGHNMKGAGAGYGFEPISRIGGELETAGNAEDGAAAVQSSKALASYLERVDVVYG